MTHVELTTTDSRRGQERIGLAIQYFIFIDTILLSASNQ